MTQRRSLVKIALCLLPGVLLLGGCGSSNMTKTFTGTPVGNETLKRIKPGKTTKEWLITALGRPTLRGEGAEGTEILKYECLEEVESTSSASAFGGTRKKTRTRHTHYFEIRDGIVQRCWKDSVELLKVSRSN